MKKEDKQVIILVDDGDEYSVHIAWLSQIEITDTFIHIRREYELIAIPSRWRFSIYPIDYKLSIPKEYERKSDEG